MIAAPTFADPAPDVNTTPLIDVLLVLLIMFIMTIPVATHSVRLDLPVGPPPEQPPVLNRNRITLSDTGALAWNGQAVDWAELRANLELAGAADTLPVVEFQPAPGARYELVDQVLVAARRANVTGLGFVGNERYRGGF